MLIDGNIFCGYYDYSPLDAENKYLLAHKVNQIDNFPKPGEECEIIIYNLNDNKHRVIDKTSAWNWQQGSRAQWLGPDFKTKVIYNKFYNGKLKSYIKDIKTMQEEMLDSPIFSISRDGKKATCFDFSRIAVCRDSYSYATLIESENRNLKVDPKKGLGLITIDLQNGLKKEILNIKQLLTIKPLKSMKTGFHWVDTPFMSPSGNTIYFLHRWTTDAGFYSRIYSINFDGTNLQLIVDSGTANHMTVIDDENIIFDGVKEKSLNAFKKYVFLSKIYKLLFPFYQKFITNKESLRQKLVQHYYYSVSKNEKNTRVEIDSLEYIGHPSVSPIDSNLFLADTYETKADDGKLYRYLYLCNRKENAYEQILKTFSPEKYNSTNFRADLHPKWNFDGNKVIVDIIENDERKVIIKNI